MILACAARSASTYAFFFSSRRRHTRSLCDWSSDVCSSDLRLKSSSVPVLFNPFKNNENNCKNCGNEFFKTLKFEQKYCKNCFYSYIRDTTGNDKYLDAYIRSEERRVGKECRTLRVSDNIIE